MFPRELVNQPLHFKTGNGQFIRIRQGFEDALPLPLELRVIGNNSILEFFNRQAAPASFSFNFTDSRLVAAFNYPTSANFDLDRPKAMDLASLSLSFFHFLFFSSLLPPFARSREM